MALKLLYEKFNQKIGDNIVWNTKCWTSAIEKCDVTPRMETNIKALKKKSFNKILFVYSEVFQ
jgi:hypothetical protein